jgi:arylsulfatase A-like enzyme
MPTRSVPFVPLPGQLCLRGMTVANTKVISNRLAYEPEASGIMPMKTYDEVLAENGYEAEYYGKWHNPDIQG